MCGAACMQRWHVTGRLHAVLGLPLPHYNNSALPAGATLSVPTPRATVPARHSGYGPRYHCARFSLTRLSLTSFHAARAHDIVPWVPIHLIRPRYHCAPFSHARPSLTSFHATRAHDIVPRIPIHLHHRPHTNPRQRIRSPRAADAH